MGFCFCYAGRDYTRQDNKRIDICELKLMFREKNWAAEKEEEISSKFSTSRENLCAKCNGDDESSKSNIIDLCRKFSMVIFL